LLELTGVDNGFLESGGIELGFDGEESRLQAEERNWQGEGVPVERLSPADLRRLEPAISSEIRTAYRLPGLCQVRNPRHVKALTAACQIRNVRIIAGAPVTQFETTGIQAGGQGILAARAPTTRYAAGKFVIAGGAWTGRITRQLGIEVPVGPVRGQIVLLSAWPLPFQHVLNHGARYLVPRPDGKILIGATEEEVGFEKQNTVAGVAGLLEFAQTLVPELAQAKVEQSWSGLRPGSPTGDPFLSRLPRIANGYVAAGHFRAGLQLSPATGELMAELITTGKPSLSLEHFRIPE
jgi:glycine oxidase